MQSKKLLILVFGLLLVASTGCISIKTGGQTGTTGGGFVGMFKSGDAAASWRMINNLTNAQGKPLYIADVNISKIIMDPNDNLALYLATDKGLYYSYDGGDSWQQSKLPGNEMIINDVAVDYNNKCIIYIATGSLIYKSYDCLRAFEKVYFDTTRQGLLITDIETDRYAPNKNVVYAANNKGDVLKSEDFGKTWQLRRNLNNNPVKKILMDKDDTRIIYFATQDAGIYKTTDSTATWSDEKPETDINKGLDQFGDSKQFRYLIQDMTEPNTLILASKFGLLKTYDGGMKWESLELVTPDRGANIYSLAMDPKDNKVIYYGTDTTLYKSVNSGVSWAPQKPPTIGWVNALLIDPKDSRIIYLGGKGLPKK
ncbi:MAG: hypothetical protein NTX82_06080 [Candidatus Parcubacteria bacterium]|nr:hypothetical protein [Candidatus Parcubacteria bacterium]